MDQITLSGDNLFSIVKYIFEKKGRPLNDTNIDSFFNNGLSFPEFACLVCNVLEIPNITNKVSSEKQIKQNNQIAFAFLRDFSSMFFENTHHWYISYCEYSLIIENILIYIYFKQLTSRYIISQSNKLFSTIGLDIHKENEIYTAIYIVRLLHILTDHEVQLIDEINNSNFEEFLPQIFNKYNIPFILNSKSFEYDQRQCVLLQCQIIFDKYQDKIKSILHDYDEFHDENPSINYNLIDNSEREDEDIFLRLVNIIGKDLGFKIYNFDEIIEEGFIPKYIMHILHIDSIENVTNVETNSMSLQIKNIEAVINYLKKDNPSIDYYYFDFQTPSKRSFSTRLLLRFIMNSYFLKTSREEMVSRYLRIIAGFQKKDKYSRLDDIFYKKSIFDSSILIKIPYFIINGRTDYVNVDSKDENNFCPKHNIPCITNITHFRSSEFDPDFADYFYYQLQIFYDLIDNGRKSLHLIEKLKNALYKVNKIKMPKCSTICSAIKAKNVIVEIKDEFQDQESIDEVKEEEEEEEEIVDLTIKMNEHPTTFKDRFTKISNIDQSQNEKSVDQTLSENPQQFWNPEELLNDAHFDNGILILNGPKNDQKVDKNSFEKWNDNINEIQKNAKKLKSSNRKQQDPLNSQLSFNIPHSQYQTKLYKIFYYNENKNKWFFDKNAFEEFSNDKKIAVENAHTPIVCYFDSKEEDLISINSNFINGNYPKFGPDLNEKQDGNQNSSKNENDKSTKSKDKKKIKKNAPKKEIKRDPNEIFVYALCDKPLSMLNYEVDFMNRNKSSIKPIILLIHVPKEKEKHPNIKSIMIQIYTFLSLICDIRIVILDKHFYEVQVQNMLNIFNIVDMNIKELIANQKDNESDEKSEVNSWSFSSIKGFVDEDADFEINYNQKNNDESKSVLFYNESTNQMIYKESKIIFLINDKTINNYNDEIDNYINDSELFINMNRMFDNQIIMHIINIEDHITYKRFLDTFNSICINHKFLRSQIINNFKCINNVSFMSSKYISIKQDTKNQLLTLKSIIQNRYSSLELKNDSLYSLSILQNEIFKYSPNFDLCFNNDSQDIIDEIKKNKIKIDRDILKKELNQSAMENLEYINYQLHLHFFWEPEQLEEFKRTHLSFLDNEYFNIIKILCNENIAGFLYEENIDILNDQIEKDQNTIQEIFSPYIKRILIKYTPKEEKFEDVKMKGTCYIMKETENIREIKVTLEMKDDLKTIIEQDF